MHTYIVLQQPLVPQPPNERLWHGVGQRSTTDAPVFPTLSVEQLPDQALAELARDPRVLRVAPVMPTRLIAPLDDPPSEDPAQPPEQQPNEAPLWGITAVQADSSPFNGAGVRVAVLDTGIDKTHPAFAGMDITERDFSGQGNGDRQGHGTHCAGSVFGRGAQRLGMAPGVQQALIGKVLGDDGAGQSDMVFQAIHWAMREHADVVSMSLGFDFPGMVRRMVKEGWPVDLATSTALVAYRENLRMFDALMAVLEANAAFGASPLVVAAAGNESRRALKRDYRIAASLPAAASDVLSVAAVGPEGDKFSVADFSNSQALVAGPGVGITSARAGGGLRTLSGTSMACACVAGVAALWWQALRADGGQPDARQVTARLLSHARRGVLSQGCDAADVGQGLVTAPQG